ncbi:MAG: Hsp20/alpha crystallin family protein [Proteobacteria bacterium]|nr:Hsp20/alpha crystallin family protein [Pseudomonadota bacterium]MBU1709668.1 Hsp20/alpha crystallin family protein [Pseudomonadota bacterium]
MTEKEMRVQEKQEVSGNAESTKPVRRFIPAVDIFETEAAVTVQAEMPGVKKEGVDIDLDEGILTIKGTQDVEEKSGERVLLREYEVGHFLRKFSISENIDQEKIQATIKNGILTLILPKVEPAKPKKVEVKIG